MKMPRIIGVLRGRKTFLALAVLLLVAVVGDLVYYAAVYRPVASQTSRLEARLAGLEKQNASAANNQKLYESFIEGRKRLDIFKSMLASRSEYTDVLKKVYNMADRDGMHWKSFGAQTNALRQVGGIEQMSFSLPVTGSYRAVRKFLFDIESSELFLNIENLGLNSGGTGGISLTIGLSTYVRS